MQISFAQSNQSWVNGSRCQEKKGWGNADSAAHRLHILHLFILADQPTCATCQAALVVRHIVNWMYSLVRLQERQHEKLFENNEIISIISYIKEIGSYQNILVKGKNFFILRYIWIHTKEF